jgi:L-threonylcarbamoyladenylate synthase
MNAGREEATAFQVATAARALRRGGIVAYPTEAVWGLGCDPANSRALCSLLAAKRRDAAKGLILVAGSIEQFSSVLAPLNTAERQLLSDSWPGPVTWLVPHYGAVHPLVSGAHATVALRVSGHPLVQALCAAFGGPVISSSANLQSRTPALDSRTVRRYFAGRVDYILPGKLGGLNKPSEIRDLASGQVLRPG